MKVSDKSHRCSCGIGGVSPMIQKDEHMYCYVKCWHCGKEGPRTLDILTAESAWNRMIGNENEKE